MTAYGRQIQEAMAALTQCVDEGNRVAVPTHYLYPSRSSVTVFVSSTSHDKFVVSDNGGAIDTIGAHGLEIDDPDKFLVPFCRPDALRAVNGKILTPRVPINAIPVAVLAVADASAKAAHQGVYGMKPRGRRDLARAVGAELKLRFSPDRVREGARMETASTRLVKFDFAITLGADQLLIVDTVLPDPNSVNAKAAAHLDLGHLEDRRLVQRIVYDPEAEWHSADLNFLQTVSKTIALPAFRDALAPFVLH